MEIETVRAYRGKSQIHGKRNKALRIRQRRRNARIFILSVILCTLGGVFSVMRYRESVPVLSSEKIAVIKDSSKWQDIFSRQEDYPQTLLDDLERNPEMLDFVAGYPDAEAEVRGGITMLESMERCPLFIQWDERWGYVPYGSSNIGISGCGPTCLSMVIFSMSRDKGATPDMLAQRAMDEGYYVKDVGTAWSFMTDIVGAYGISVNQFGSLKEEAMADRMKDGDLLICAMGPGDFTDQGHFIVISGYSKDGFLVKDPFSYTNSNREWSYDILSSQIQQIWVYSS